jgi:hypothetical protein
VGAIPSVNYDGLIGTEAPRRTRRIHGGIAAPVDDDATA